MWIHDGEDDVTWGYRDRPAPTVTGGGGKASGIELFDQGSRKKMLQAIASSDDLTGTIKACGCEWANHNADFCEAASESGIVPMREKHWRNNPDKAQRGIDELNAADLRMVTAMGNGRVVNPKTPLDPIRVTVEEAAILQSYPPVWRERPATTVAGSPIVAGPGRSDFVKGGVSRQDRPGRYDATIDEMGTLQTYPPFPDGFIWKGAKTKQYMQIGNAVPPLQAQVVLEALWAIPVTRTEELELAA